MLPRSYLFRGWAGLEVLWGGSSFGGAIGRRSALPPPRGPVSGVAIQRVLNLHPNTTKSSSGCRVADPPSSERARQLERCFLRLHGIRLKSGKTQSSAP